MEEKGHLLPIKDELDVGSYKPEEFDVPAEVTSDEESELGNLARPRKGAGWWGQGPPINASKKSVLRDFVDGGGLCSPGRWPMDRRRLPNGYLVKRLRTIILDGFRKAADNLKKDGKVMDLKKLLVVLSLGHYKDQPFDPKIVEEVQDGLRRALREGGHGDGLPREGDRAQVFEIRLIQALLEACEDPDHYFCERWARGVWLGSMSRKLPRTPAVFDRKTKWR